MVTGRNPGGDGLVVQARRSSPEWDAHQAIPALLLRASRRAASTGPRAPRRRSARCCPARPHLRDRRGRDQRERDVQHPLGGPGWRRDPPSRVLAARRASQRVAGALRRVAARSARPARHASAASADVLLDYLVPEVDPDVALLWFPEPDTSQHAAGVGAGPAIQALAAADGRARAHPRGAGRARGHPGRARGLGPRVLDDRSPDPARGGRAGGRLSGGRQAGRRDRRRERRRRALLRP